MINPFISIVIPVYNAEKSIGNVIHSLLTQSFQNFELIIIDDGSQDKTVAVIKSFHDKRIITKKIPNGGPGNARNIGIKEATGEYLIFVDSDDVLEADNLQKRVKYIRDDKVDLVIGSYQTKVMNNEEIVDTKLTIAPDVVYRTNNDFVDNIYFLMEKQLMYVIWNKVYRLDIIKKFNVSFPSYRSCEDRLFNLQYFSHVDYCRVTSEIFYNYSFDGKNSLTNKYFDNKFDTFEEFYLTTVRMAPQDLAGFSSLFLKGTMSCLIPLHTSSCNLSNSGKKEYIHRVINNTQVQNAADASARNGLMKKLFKLIFKIKNVTLHYLISWILFKVSNINPKIIEKLKRSF